MLNLKLDNLNINDENKQIQTITIGACGGAIGGIGNTYYAKTNGISDTKLVDNIVVGSIASVLLVCFFVYNSKKPILPMFLFALAIAGGIYGGSIFKFVGSVISSQLQIAELQSTVDEERRIAIEQNKLLAQASTDPVIQEQAIKNIGAIAERSEKPEESITAIKELAKDEPLEVKQQAIEELSDIVANTENTNTAKEVAIALKETTKANPELFLETLRELEQAVIDAETEAIRKTLIFEIADYGDSQKNHQATLWVGAKLNDLHENGYNNYLVFDEDSGQLMRIGNK